MTKQQKRRLIKVIRNDCHLDGTYRKGDKTCAIGALLLASTKPRSKERQIMLENDGVAIRSDSLQAVRAAITRTFGLTREQMQAIQWANDAIAGKDRESVAARRREVLGEVESFRTKG